MQYLALDDGAPGFPQGGSDPVVLGILLRLVSISLTGLSPSLASLPMLFCYRYKSYIRVPQHRCEKSQRFRLFPVRSPLLGESRIDLYSYRYLDVSVPCVRFNWLLYSPEDNGFYSTGFSHSDTCGSKLVWQLTALFRGLLRPSSLACPKASTSCPESLIFTRVPI